MPKNFDSWASWSSQSSNILYPHSGRKRYIMRTNKMNQVGFSEVETMDEVVFTCLQPKKLSNS